MRRLVWIALFALAALALPSQAFAGKSYSVAQAFVTVTLSPDGEVLVREALTFSYNGHFTGAYRDIPLAQDVQVRDVTVHEGGTAYTPGGNTALGSSDAEGRFGFVRTSQGLRIVWHYVQDGGQRTFILSYRLRGVVIAHDDAVEVAPQVWGDQWKDGLKLLYANVQAPAANGETYGWIEPVWLSHRVSIRGSFVQSVIHDVPSKRSVTLRVLYPPSVLAPDAPYAKHVHDDIVPKTIAREQAAGNRAAHDKQQVEDTLHHPLYWILALCALALLPALLLGAFAYLYFGREHETGNAAEYVHDAPDDLAPALVPSLLAQKVVAGGDQLTATLFELVRRGRYKMTPVTREESSFAGLRHKEVDDVDLTVGDETVELSPVEQPVAAIFDRLAQAGPAALSQVADTVKEMSQSDREWFHDRSEAFESAVGTQVRQRKFWVGRGMVVMGIAFAVFALSGALLLYIGIRGLTDPPLVRQDLILTAIGAAMVLNAVVLLVLPASMWRRTRPDLRASAEAWEGFRRYLNDFPRLADKPADTLPLWESYLVYGIAFGIAERVLEAAKVSFPDISTSSVYAPALYVSSFSASSFGSSLGSFPSPSSGSGGGGSFGGGGGGAW